MMMRALAEFIMRGRLQAAILPLLSVPLLTQGAIALVALRKGAIEGALMVLVSLVPALLAWIMGRPSEAIFWGTLLGVLSVYVPAVFLRATTSWSFSVLACLATSSLTVLAVVTMVPGLSETFGQATATLVAVMQGQSPDTALPEPSFVALSGLLAMGMLFNGLAGLLIARWWQAMLYNPGGFGEEFRSFRIGILPSMLCMILVVLCYFQSVDYSFWATTFAGPLILVAIAIVHSVVKVRQLSRHWLFVFYILIVIFSPLLLVLSIIGFIDSWLNIRGRLVVSEKE